MGPILNWANRAAEASSRGRPSRARGTPGKLRRSSFSGGRPGDPVTGPNQPGVSLRGLSPKGRYCVRGGRECT